MSRSAEFDPTGHPDAAGGLPLDPPTVYRSHHVKEPTVSTAAIHPGTRNGAVHVTVSDLGRSVAYYRDAIGLTVLETGLGRASLGSAGEGELLRLVELPGARPSRGHTGLFHFALRVPDRADLARWLLHAARAQVPLAGLSDHFVSEAIYLQDPDDHGIEIYHDRPRDLWEGRVDRMVTMALDVDDLLEAIEDPATEPFDGLPAGTDMGHVHLRVAEIPGTIAFYRDVVGLDLMATYGPDAAFLAAGGYHHHIGANVWQSRGAPAAPPGTASLQLATLLVPDPASVDEVAARATAAGYDPGVAGDGVRLTDPSGNEILLAVR